MVLAQIRDPTYCIKRGNKTPATRERNGDGFAGHLEGELNERFLMIKQSYSPSSITEVASDAARYRSVKQKTSEGCKPNKRL